MRISFYRIVICVWLMGSLNAMESITERDLGYREICKKAAEDLYHFYNFRSMPAYVNALVEIQNQDNRFAEYIEKSPRGFLKKLEAFRKLDSLGNPVAHQFLNLGRFSTTTLRYIAIGRQIQDLFSLPSKSTIVEIGAGFGGQCYILSKLYFPAKYYIYDLPETNALIEKVMKTLIVKNVVCMPVSEQLPQKKIDLFVSNYAFSECDRDLQMDYFERVIKKADRGYVMYNQIAGDALSPEEFVALLEKNHMHPTVYKEPIPTFHNNLLIVWDKTRNKCSDTCSLKASLPMVVQEFKL